MRSVVVESWGAALHYCHLFLVPIPVLIQSLLDHKYASFVVQEDQRKREEQDIEAGTRKGLEK